LHAQGLSLRAIAEEIGRSHTTVHSFLRDRWAENHTIRDGRELNPGRPRIIDDRLERLIIREFGRNPLLDVEAFRRNNDVMHISRWTISRIMTRNGLNRMAAFYLHDLTLEDRRQRLAFARAYSRWTADMWERVVFLDQASFENLPSRRVGTYRRRGEGFNEQAVVPRLQAGGGKIIVNGVISARGTGNLIRLTRTMNAETFQEFLEDNIIPNMRELVGRNGFLLLDNAPPHRARTTTQWFQDNRVNLVRIPPRSPDLNPIEGIWRLMKQRRGNRRTRRLNELTDLVQDLWADITREDCRRLIRSMPARIDALIQANGGYTRY
jgi:transposase